MRFRKAFYLLAMYRWVERGIGGIRHTHLIQSQVAAGSNPTSPTKEMHEIPFPPNLKKPRASGHTEWFYQCPRCSHIHWLVSEVDEIIRGIIPYGVYTLRDCYPAKCRECKGEFTLMTSRSNCSTCAERIECLFKGSVEVRCRKMYKPYSTILPRRMTVWE